MIKIFRAEWRKLRRPTLFFGSLFAVGFVSAMITAFIFILIDAPTGNAKEGAQAMVVTREMLALPEGVMIGFASSGALLGIVALSVFAAQTAQEFSLGTLRNLLVRQPNRIKLLMGKYISMITFIALAVVVSLISAIAIAYLLAGNAGVSTTAWRSGDAIKAILESYRNVCIAAIGYGTIGMALGIYLRSPISAISIGVGWLLVVENIIAAAWKASMNWLPGQLLSVISNGGENYGAALIKISVTLILLVLSFTYIFKRRDVAN